MRRGAISFVGAAVLLVAVGCGDETDTGSERDDDSAETAGDAGKGSTQSGRDGGSSNAGGDGGVSQPDAGKGDHNGDDDDDGDGDETDAGADDPGSACDEPPGDEDYGECTEAEVKAYAACVDDTCGDKMAACYGSGYASGKAGGVCKSYVECTNKCECNDTACFAACQPSAECSACQREVASCSTTCFRRELTCAGGDDLPGDPTKTCEDLATCCSSLADAEQQAECNLAYELLSQQAGTADLACSFAIEDYCP